MEKPQDILPHVSVTAQFEIGVVCGVQDGRRVRDHAVVNIQSVIVAQGVGDLHMDVPFKPRFPGIFVCKADGIRREELCRKKLQRIVPAAAVQKIGLPRGLKKILFPLDQTVCVPDAVGVSSNNDALHTAMRQLVSPSCSQQDVGRFSLSLIHI